MMCPNATLVSSVFVFRSFPPYFSLFFPFLVFFPLSSRLSPPLSAFLSVFCPISTHSILFFSPFLFVPVGIVLGPKYSVRPSIVPQRFFDTIVQSHWCAVAACRLKDDKRHAYAICIYILSSYHAPCTPYRHRHWIISIDEFIKYSFVDRDDEREICSIQRAYIVFNLVWCMQCTCTIESKNIVEYGRCTMHILYAVFKLINNKFESRILIHEVTFFIFLFQSAYPAV